jgi:hypothetical protein
MGRPGRSIPRAFAFAAKKALQNLNQQLHVFFFNFSRLLVVLAARYSFLFYFENEFSDG